MKDNTLALITLSYFKQHWGKYDLGELLDLLGVTPVKFQEILYEAMENKFICYENNLLLLTLHGRLFLANTKIDNYKEADFDDIEESFFGEKISLEEPYFVQNFSKYRWRGNNQ